MKHLNDLNIARQQIISGYSIRQLIRQRWLVVALALILTGLGAALTGVLFKTGIHTLDTLRLGLL